MKKLNIVYMGTPDFSVGPLEKLIEKYNVVMVVTQPDKEIGRKKEIKFSPVKECAIKNNIKVFQPGKIRENYKEIFNSYYGMFLMDNSSFTEIFNKYDQNDLIDKLRKNVAIVEYL